MMADRQPLSPSGTFNQSDATRIWFVSGRYPGELNSLAWRGWLADLTFSLHPDIRAFDGLFG